MAKVAAKGEAFQNTLSTSGGRFNSGEMRV